MLPVMLKFSAFWLARFSESHFLPKMDTHNIEKTKAGAISYPSSIFFKKGLKRSIGMGKSMVEFFSVAISESVCR